MRRRSSWAVPLLVSLGLGLSQACGKRADPLAPYVKTPQPPGALEVSQIGDEIEIRITAPRSPERTRFLSEGVADSCQTRPAQWMPYWEDGR